jgi:hypothetical protein
MLYQHWLHASAGDQSVMQEGFVPDETEDAPRKPLTPAARRALAEAEARRRDIDAKAAGAPKEEGGRGGLEPARYGDWEIKGLTSDF